MVSYALNNQLNDVEEDVCTTYKSNSNLRLINTVMHYVNDAYYCIQIVFIRFKNLFSTNTGIFSPNTRVDILRQFPRANMIVPNENHVKKRYSGI